MNMGSKCGTCTAKSMFHGDIRDQLPLRLDGRATDKNHFLHSCPFNVRFLSGEYTPCSVMSGNVHSVQCQVLSMFKIFHRKNGPPFVVRSLCISIWFVWNLCVTSVLIQFISVKVRWIYKVA